MGWHRDGGEKGSILDQVARAAFETCPKLVSTPVANGRKVAEQDGFHVELTKFDLLRTPAGGSGQIAFGRQTVANLTESTSGEGCLLVFSSPIRDEAKALVIDRLKASGFMLEREILNGSIYRKQVGQRVHRAQVNVSDDGVAFDFLSNAELPVLIVTFTY